MLQGLASVASLMNGWTPLTQSGAWMVGVVFLVLWLNSTRFSEKKGQAEFNDKRRTDLMEEVNHEQERRMEADARGDRWRSAARWWNAKAHDERLERIEDRGTFQQVLATLPSAPKVVFPAMMPLPRMVEDVAEGGTN